MLSEKIGPLLTASDVVAADLLADLASLAAGAQVMLDAPDDTPGSAANARALGFIPVFETARMWKGKPPTRVPGLEFGVGTLELG